MDGRKLVIGTITTLVVAFGLSGLWHIVLMADFYEAASGGAAREAPLMWSVLLGYLIVALIMAYMYPKGYEGGSLVAEGFKFGAMIGIVWWLASQLVLYGAVEGPFSVVYVDGAWHVLEEGLAGIALAMVYGRDDRGSDATS
jgi:hypothetical protein